MPFLEWLKFGGLTLLVIRNTAPDKAEAFHMHR